MDPIIEKILFTIGGVIVTAVGFLAKEYVTEKKRKREKVENAYLLWLNTEFTITNQLKELIDSTEKHNTKEFLLVDRSKSGLYVESDLPTNLIPDDEKLKLLNSEIQRLNDALHQALIYEVNIQIKVLIENQTNYYSIVSNYLSTIISHQSQHLGYYQILSRIDEGKNNATNMRDKLIKKNETNQNDKLSADLLLVDEFEENHLKLKDQTEIYLTDCNTGLKKNINYINGLMTDIDRGSKLIRSLITK